MFVILPLGPPEQAPALFVEGVPGARAVCPEDILPWLQAFRPASPVPDAAMAPRLADAARRLTPIARGTGGDATVILSRDAAGGTRLSVGAGGYRFDSHLPGLSMPRPGDADFLWGERARAVAQDLAEAGWPGTLRGNPGEVALVARAAGVFLFASPGGACPPLVHLAMPGGRTAFAGFQPPDEDRSLVDRFAACVPLQWLPAAAHARAVAGCIGRFLVPLAELDEGMRSDPRLVVHCDAALALARCGEGEAARSRLVDGAGMFADEADAWLAAQGAPVAPVQDESASAGRARTWLARVPGLRARRERAAA